MRILLLVYIITYHAASQNRIPLQFLFQIRRYLYHHLPFLLADDAFVSRHFGLGYLVGKGTILIPTAWIKRAPTSFSVTVSLTQYLVPLHQVWFIFAVVCIHIGPQYLFDNTFTTENSHNALSVYYMLRNLLLILHWVVVSDTSVLLLTGQYILAYAYFTRDAPKATSINYINTTKYIQRNK
jgi:hypothetical protein